MWHSEPDCGLKTSFFSFLLLQESLEQKYPNLSHQALSVMKVNMSSDWQPNTLARPATFLLLFEVLPFLKITTGVSDGSGLPEDGPV